MIGALIFDMDGVLVDNSATYKVAWQRFLSEQGEAVRPDYPAHNIFGRRNADLMPEVFLRALTAEEIAECSDRLEAIYWQIAEQSLQPTPGLKAFLAAARERDLPRALATSAPAKNAALTLGLLGLSGAFAPMLTEEDVARGKPDPEIYLQAAARLGRPPAECVVFEDSLPGVLAARGAGAACVGLATSVPGAELAAAGAGLVIADFMDAALPTWLGWPPLARAAEAGRPGRGMRS